MSATPFRYSKIHGPTAEGKRGPATTAPVAGEANPAPPARVDRPSYIKFCAACDHPEGDHAGRATMWGPRQGGCYRDECDCQGFTLSPSIDFCQQDGEMR